ncbi:hypothetical protein KM176_06160 [Pseudooceanicola sp. CBS1P-1]|uniref:Uncharacterized protein n=1 Tax=Pseudooceanicola albus TaxID=2692189 RepID=A0A6L7FXU7_9RHOB|nr:MULTISPECIES: hypothetical protein [Pseudooceanicola]MBT9383436.1 hypothetical protein [Pseudooceanicola endophyticus]MXN16242.1 hypothetical protein [Pseudooceanicola albus]
MRKRTAGLLLATVTALPLHANDFEASMRDYLESEVLLWAFDPQILAAVRAQNSAHEGLSQDQILTLDGQWRAEVGTPNEPMVDAVTKTPLADFLRDRMAGSGGIVTEIFVMDDKGLNVAATGATSDYWQGDEGKFTETYGKGVGAVHVGEVEFDDSAQTYQGQISVSVADPATRELLGALTVGLNAEMLY